MKTVEINTRSFFEMLKERDASMWDVFAQLIDGTPKTLLFTGDEGEVLFSYSLPETEEQLKAGQKRFAEEYQSKLNALN